MLIFSFVVVATKVNIKLPDDIQNQSLSDKLRRIDFFGSLTLVGAVGCLLLGFSLKSTEEMQWSNPLIIGLLVASVVFGFFFVLVEKHWAPYPVMPLRLMTQRTPLAVSISNLLLSMSAFSMVSSMPYFFRGEDNYLMIPVALQCATGEGFCIRPFQMLTVPVVFFCS